MSTKQYKDYKYSYKEDYDVELKINGENLKVYSSSKAQTFENCSPIGETFENRKRDKENDLGRIDLNGKWLYVGKNGKHNNLFKKNAAFVETEGGELIAILKTRILPIILIAAIVICGIGLVVNKIVNPEKSELNVKVEVADDKTPAVEVNGLNGIAQKYAIKGQTVNITLLATKLSEDRVPTADYKLIKQISGETTLTFFDFSIFKEQFNKRGISLGKSGIYETDEPIEVVVPFDSTYTAGTYIFRVHDGEASRFSELKSRPTGNFEDGTYFVTAKAIYVYTKYFSTYAIGTVQSDHSTRGSDTLTYSSKATVDVSNGTVQMLYEHDADSTHESLIEIYLKGADEDVLLSRSNAVKPGEKLSSMILITDKSMLPANGSYTGLMKIYYLDASGRAATNVDIPLNVTITGN